jgi:hypothetical protein
MGQALVNEDAHTTALRALVWTLGDTARADRLLGVTGLDPVQLRARIADPAVLAATLAFLLANEADLIACAEGLGVPPQAIVRAAAELEAA